MGWWKLRASVDGTCQPCRAAVGAPRGCVAGRVRRRGERDGTGSIAHLDGTKRESRVENRVLSRARTAEICLKVGTVQKRRDELQATNKILRRGDPPAQTHTQPQSHLHESSDLRFLSFFSCLRRLHSRTVPFDTTSRSRAPNATSSPRAPGDRTASQMHGTPRL